MTLVPYDIAGVLVSGMDPSIRVDCNSLVDDILSYSIGSSPRWQLLQSGYTELVDFKDHLDGRVASLLGSVEHNCHLCRLILAQLRKCDGYTLESEYCIFVRDQAHPGYQFEVGVGNAHHFIEGTGNWKARRVLALSRRNGASIPMADAWRLRRSPFRDQRSTAAVQQARTWFEDCSKNHAECARPHMRLPKRVLDISAADEQSGVRLYVTNGEMAPYASLSYCWGRALGIRTTRRTFHEHCRGIPLSSLPNTLRDAVQIARRLDFQYLWIDSLCIIQFDADDLEGQHDAKLDWAEQSLAMTEIYGGSSLNISASSCNANDDVMLKTLPDQGVRVRSYQSDNTDEGMNAISAIEFGTTLDLEQMSSSSRGWIFQERLVSPATVHYTEAGMIWECARGILLEHDQPYHSIKWKSNWKAAMGNGLSNRAGSTSESACANSLHDQFESWNEWVSAFSERKLTHYTDKLPAMAGVAKGFAEAFGLTQSYAVGLWRQNIASGLLWRRYNRKPTLVRFRPPMKYVAPSWSWASVQGRLEYRNIILTPSTKGPSVEILRVDILEKHPGTFGQVYSGQIEAKGMLQKITIDRAFHPGNRQRAFQECGVIEGVALKNNFLCTLDEWSELNPPLYHCWCFRIGSHSTQGKQTSFCCWIRRSMAVQTRSTVWATQRLNHTRRIQRSQENSHLLS